MKRPFSLKQKMVEQFKIDWSTKLSTSDRFSTYTTFKSVFQPEEYLNYVTIKKIRDSLVRLRLGINDLGVNKRFCQTNVQSNKCKFCPDGVEDGHHFLFQCTTYNSIRDKYLGCITDQSASVTLKALFENSTTEISRKVAMFIYYALKQRDELLS